jgi:hypothetical protein
MEVMANGGTNALGTGSYVSLNFVSQQAGTVTNPANNVLYGFDRSLTSTGVVTSVGLNQVGTDSTTKFYIDSTALTPKLYFGASGSSKYIDTTGNSNLNSIGFVGNLQNISLDGGTATFSVDTSGNVTGLQGIFGSLTNNATVSSATFSVSSEGAVTAASVTAPSITVTSGSLTVNSGATVDLSAATVDGFTVGDGANPSTLAIASGSKLMLGSGATLDVTGATLAGFDTGSNMVTPASGNTNVVMGTYSSQTIDDYLGFILDYINAIGH